MIRAGSLGEAKQESGQWIFVDMGFAKIAKSCGILVRIREPIELTFAGLCEHLTESVQRRAEPLNLVIEAPLSVAFNSKGNPTGRSIERRESHTRYWYTGLGCSVLVAATYLLRALVEAQPVREVRLFEGLVSFKPKGVPSSHCDDVIRLREVVRSGGKNGGKIIPPEALAAFPSDQVASAFAVAGMDFGVPPVIVVSSQ